VGLLGGSRSRQIPMRRVTLGGEDLGKGRGRVPEPTPKAENEQEKKTKILEGALLFLV